MPVKMREGVAFRNYGRDAGDLRRKPDLRLPNLKHNGRPRCLDHGYIP
jgi:hypothetical protein